MIRLVALLVVLLGVAHAQPAQPEHPEPFAFGDFTWLNGANRQKLALLDTKYVTFGFLFDANYSFSFNRPVDDTIVGSTVTGRHNEVNILMASPEMYFHYGHVHAALSLQLGSYATLIPRNDPSVNRGQYDLTTAFRYIREAYAGYHWDGWRSGINLDAGIFMSYVGLFSYLNYENWAYQPSYVSDNTPFFFQGIRLQLFPTDHVKVELWVVNGFQSYAKFNEAPGVGYQILFRPSERQSFSFNGYVGIDTANAGHRVRFLSDNSYLLRYYDRPGGRGLHRIAFSVTADVGFEGGDGVTPFGGAGGPAQYFVGAMAYHRMWFHHDTFGLTLGGGFIQNPGRYLVLAPPGQATNTAYANAFTFNPGQKFFAWDLSATFDYMPNPFITYRFEVTHREANVPYFAGHGGVTSPDGYTTTAIPQGWQPDLVKQETRLILAMMFRI